MLAFVIFMSGAMVMVLEMVGRGLWPWHQTVRL